MKKFTIPDTASYMMAVPRDKSEIQTPEAVMYRLRATKELNIKNIEINKFTGHLNAKVEYKGKTYSIDFYADKFVLPKGYVFFHRLKQEDINSISGEINGITTIMHFSDNAQESYHLQLKFLQCIIPNMACAIDFNTERVLSGTWVAMSAITKILPAPYHVCAVSAVSESPESKYAWLHTHGLNRCGFREIEVINADKQRAEYYGDIMNTLVTSILCERKFADEKTPVNMSDFSDASNKLSVAWLDWHEAVEKYDDSAIGNKADHEEGHNMFVSSLFACSDDGSEYIDFNDVDESVIKANVWKIPVAETARERAMALERFGFLGNGIALHKNARALVKVCVPFVKDGNNAVEYVWLELHKAEKDKIYGKVENQPAFIPNVKQGDHIQVDIHSVADWILYTENYNATPDTAYLVLEELAAAEQDVKAKKKADEPKVSAADIAAIDDIISKMD